ncbi:MAG: hypothetical protein OXI20_16775 [Rhodospirillales bacterium]|nr:hypothetical protein [Rhodospirillales bacterium]
MTAIEGGGKRDIARARSIYCSPENHALIARRAKEAGMSFSRFMIACALHGADEDDEEGPRLVLTEDEQPQLLERVALLNRCNEALLSRLPGTGISALGALAFLIREAQSRSVDASGDGS